MKTAFRQLLFFVALSVAATVGPPIQANEFFRGILKSQGGNEILDSPSEFAPFYIDIAESFSRDGALVGTDADGWAIGFVSPLEIDPATGQQPLPGPLQGILSEMHGRWMANSPTYVTTGLDGGSVSRTTADGRAVACLPWRVWSGLGDSYFLEMSAVVATGETVTVGYFGDPAFGSALGLDGRLGQLVLNVTRGTGVNANRVYTSVAWDENGSRIQFSTGNYSSAEGEEITLGLGWEDVTLTNSDLFDAWLTVGGEARELLGGHMNTAIDVFGIGFEISGIASRVTGFVGAVPEPASGPAILFGLMFGCGLLRRR